MKYNKLVRDKIPEYIESKGGKPIFHTADEEEFRRKLWEKLQEEAKEFSDSGSIDEIADVLEVVDAICEYHGFTRTEVERVKVNKALEKGRFSKKIILDES